MYLAEYPDPQLGGLGSKLKKVVKKVVKPIAHIGAAVLTGGASIPISAQMLAASNAKKAAAKEQARLDAAAAEEQKRIDALNKQTAELLVSTAKTQAAPQVSAIAAPFTSVSTVAPSAAAIAATLPPPTSPTSPQPIYMTQPSSREDGAPMQAAASPSTLPPWAVPAGLAAVAALFVLSRNRRAPR